MPATCCCLHRAEWKAAIEASAAAASKQLQELQQKLAAEAAAAPGRDKALLQQAQEAAKTLVAARVDAAKAELMKQLEGWGEKVKAAAGVEAGERVKTGAEVGGVSQMQMTAAAATGWQWISSHVFGPTCRLVCGRMRAIYLEVSLSQCFTV